MDTLMPESPRTIRSNVQPYLMPSQVDSSRGAVKIDLVQKITYNDENVFRRLRVWKVNDAWVSECASSLKIHKEAEITLLKNLVATASNRTNEELEFDERTDIENDKNKEKKSGNHGSREEKQMYDPLVTLFSYITTFNQTTSGRKFTKTRSMLKADEPHTFGFHSASPDLTLTVAGGRVNPLSSKKWRHRDAFGEVKPSNEQGPNPKTPGTIPSILIQCSDYARLFMSARPFMLFCVGVMIFGTKLCVGIFDRDGITVSPIYDMFDDVEMLVRIVHSLACTLSIEDLGSDPTARVLTDQETKQLTGRNPNYPSAVISSVGNDPRKWCTIGPPIWTSVSFLGRGTNVWRVREYVENKDGQPFLSGNVKILKTAWRSSGRTSESDIYLSIGDPKPKGLAEFECGGDVRFPYTGFPITVRNLRSGDKKKLEDGDPSTPVLHRLLLLTVGRPLYDYNSDRELLTGFRDALIAHKNLCDRNILHRDISAGNVLLAETEIDGFRGFITDVEFARIKSDTIRLPQVSVTTPISERPIHGPHGKILAVKEPTTRTYTRFESETKVKRGEGMTGTAQFMAWEILKSSPGSQVVHQPHHDVESFIWVFSYCVMRNLQTRATSGTAPQEVRGESTKAFKRRFIRAFGQATAEDIASERQARSDALDFPTNHQVNSIVTSFMSAPLISLFRDFQEIVHLTGAFRNPLILKHSDLLEVVNKAIASLQS